MHITICGSIDCSDTMIAVANQLEVAGHQVDVPYYTQRIQAGEVSLEDYRAKKAISGDTHFRNSASEDLIKRYWKYINACDAILVANAEKNGIPNYVGGNSLIEMAFAYVLDKPMYLLNDIPKLSYADEIIAMKPILLHGNVLKIA